MRKSGGIKPAPTKSGLIGLLGSGASASYFRPEPFGSGLRAVLLESKAAEPFFPARLVGLSEDRQQIKEESVENRGGMVLIGVMGYLGLRGTRYPQHVASNDDKRTYF